MKHLTLFTKMNIQTGLETARIEALGNIKYIFNDWVIPFALIAIVAVIIFNLVRLAKHRKNGEDYQDNITALIICIIVFVVVASFPAWGWQMLGIKEITSSVSGA